MKIIKIVKTKDNILKDDTQLVKYTDMNNIKEVMYIQKSTNIAFHITKLNKNEYMINETGEICKYKHTENRQQNIDSLRKTFKKIRNIINYNFTGAKNELVFTLTYAENITDTKRLYVDFKKFMKRLRYKYQKQTKIEYMSIVEPQGRGAWHCHVLLKFVDVKKIYIPNNEIWNMWSSEGYKDKLDGGEGYDYTKVKAIKTKGVDNIGAYLSAYLGDIELTEDNAVEIFKHNGFNQVIGDRFIDREVDGVKKRFIKGGRLYLYPTGMNIYRKSSGIKQPTSEWITYGEVKKRIGQHKPTYTTVIDILDDNQGNKPVNLINYEFYNLKRKGHKIISPTS